MTTRHFRTVLLALATLLAAACTTIGHREPPADWPLLKRTLHPVLPAVVWQQCYPFLPTWQKLLGAIPEGCAQIRWGSMTCDIFVADVGTGLDPRVLEHEYAHCEGRDHPGSAQLAEAWEKWKAAMTAGGARYCYVTADGRTTCIGGQR